MKNMLKLLVPTLLLIGHLQTMFAQCITPAENCYELVCVFSKTELEAAPWSSAGFTAAPLPVGGYCSQIQNDQWFAFAAADDTVRLTVTPSNCINGDGIQVAVYSSCDGPPVVCNPGCAVCGNMPTNITLATKPGIIFYMLIDGLSGDECDFTISAMGVSNNPPSIGTSGLIDGKVLWDINQDCLPDPGDPAATGIAVRFEGEHQLTKASKADGSFRFYYKDPDDVVVSIGKVPGNYWTACQSSYVVNPDSFPDITQVNFLLTPLVSCAYMQVDLGLPPFFRPCMPTGAAVKYCNTGTTAAENAYIEVTVPQGIKVDSTSIPIAAQYGDMLRFDVGTVQPFQCESFLLYLKPQCGSTQIGQTKCLSAHIYPDTVCSIWTRAHIEITTKCIGDSTIQFKLHNRGLAPSSPGLEYTIIEDQVVLCTGPFNLSPSDSFIIEKPAKGSTWRIEAEQEPGHPGRSMPAMALEGCGGFVSTGLINSFRQDDADDFIDIECIPLRTSYDPNLKVASPSGVGSNHLIEQNTPIEYIIHFQNTGTDTAFSVRLLDTLPNNLDVNTFRPGTSSHPCTWQIIDDHILEVLFSPITLPDSNVNERASHGWFEFSMDQKANLAKGSKIENRAAIYFDYHAPVITEAAWHTVGKISVSIHEPMAERSPWRVLGNPARASCTFQALVPITGPSHFELTDAQGRPVHSAEFSGQQYTFERGQLAPGIYFFRIQTAQEGAVAGKIVLHD